MDDYAADLFEQIPCGDTSCSKTIRVLRDQRLRPTYCDDCVQRREREERAARIAGWRADALRRLQELSELPPIFRPATFEGCRADGMPAHAVDAAEAWPQGVGGLLLTGPVGVGKSTLAAAAAKALIEADAQRIAEAREGERALKLSRQSGVWWTTGPGLFAALGSGRFDSPERQRAVELLLGTRGLVLDDLDKVRPSEYAAEQLYVAIDKRITHFSPLLITTNLGLDELEARWPGAYGEAIISRLVGHCDPVVIDGVDRRLRSREAAA